MTASFILSTAVPLAREASTPGAGPPSPAMGGGGPGRGWLAPAWEGVARIFPGTECPGYDPVMSTSRARLLRRNLTDAERKLWTRLRRNQLDGHYFRRQVPVGRFIVDFLCKERRLVVEVDGGQHAVRHAADASRSQVLRRRGYRVIRFWNNEVLENIDGVLETIRAELDAPAG